MLWRNAAGDPILLLVVVPTGIILTGAALGIADALRHGLRIYFLRLMRLDDELIADESRKTGARR